MHKDKGYLPSNRRDDGTNQWAIEQIVREWIEDYVDEAQVWTWEAFCKDEQIEFVGQDTEWFGFSKYVERQMGIPKVLWDRIILGTDWGVIYDVAKAQMYKWTRRYEESNK